MISQALLMVRSASVETLAVRLALFAGCVLLLMWAAIFNRFPLIFPDSGTYLGIAFAPEYAIDRSSAYGWFLKPFVSTLPNAAGLWLALTAQAVIIAGILFIAVNNVIPEASRPVGTAAILFTAVATSLPWHAGQFMPDAFTGPLVLVSWLAASRDSSDPGTPTLWLVATALAMTHYTHLVLLPITAAVTIAADACLGTGLRRCAKRAATALLASCLAALFLASANKTVLNRASVSPAGPLFLFARLNEDGLIAPWLASHCGRDAPAELCAIAPKLPRDSQQLLWGGANTPITTMIWHAEPEERWRWIDQMAVANRGAIAAQPLRFLSSAAGGMASQLVAFQALDDECPVGCQDIHGGIAFTLNRDRPETVAQLHASRQVLDQNPKRLIRAITTPLAAVAMLLCPFAILICWRRRDRISVSLLVAVGTSVLANAAMAGALSDVHDRYQSRIVWLVPMVLLLAWYRLRMAVPAVGSMRASDRPEPKTAAA